MEVVQALSLLSSWLHLRLKFKIFRKKWHLSFMMRSTTSITRMKRTKPPVWAQRKQRREVLCWKNGSWQQWSKLSTTFDNQACKEHRQRIGLFWGKNEASYRQALATSMNVCNWLLAEIHCWCHLQWCKWTGNTGCDSLKTSQHSFSDLLLLCI